MWNRTRLCQLTGKEALHPITFYAIQHLALSPRQKDFLACLKIKVVKKIFEILSVANTWVVGLTYWSKLSLSYSTVLVYSVISQDEHKAATSVRIVKHSN